MKNEWKDKEMDEGNGNPCGENHGADGGGHDRDYSCYESGKLAGCA